MEEKKEERLPGAGILASLVTAVMILTMIPLMLGFTDAMGAVASLVWLIPGFIILMIVIVRLFQEGDAVGAAVNAVLSGMALCQAIGRGMIILAFMLAGKEMPAALASNMNLMSGGGFMAAGVFLLVMAALSMKGGQKVQGGFVLLPAIGFILLGAGSYGAGMLTLPGFVLLAVFGFYLLYQAVAMTVHFVTGEKKLSY